MDKVEELKTYLIDTYKDDKRIIGIYISGSCADNSYDIYSDVDMRFIVDTSDLNNSVTEFKMKLFNSTKNILFFEPCCFENAFIAHFDNFIKADIFFYTTDMLKPSVWLRDICIIKDFDYFLLTLKQKSKQLTFEININNIENDISKYFALSHECFRRIKRKEYLYANELLQNMKEIIINFYDCLNDRVPILWYKVERRFNDNLLCIFSLTIHSYGDNIEILKLINSIFLEVEYKLCKKYNISRDFEKDTYILNYFL